MNNVILWHLYYFLKTFHKLSNKCRIFLINFVVFHEHNTIIINTIFNRKIMEYLPYPLDLELTPSGYHLFKPLPDPLNKEK